MTTANAISVSVSNKFLILSNSFPIQIQILIMVIDQSSNMQKSVLGDRVDTVSDHRHQVPVFDYDHDYDQY